MPKDEKMETYEITVKLKAATLLSLIRASQWIEDQCNLEANEDGYGLTLKIKSDVDVIDSVAQIKQIIEARRGVSGEVTYISKEKTAPAHYQAPLWEESPAP